MGRSSSAPGQPQAAKDLRKAISGSGAWHPHLLRPARLPWKQKVKDHRCTQRQHSSPHRCSTKPTITPGEENVGVSAQLADRSTGCTGNSWVRGHGTPGPRFTPSLPLLGPPRTPCLTPPALTFPDPGAARPATRPLLRRRRAGKRPSLPGTRGSSFPSLLPHTRRRAARGYAGADGRRARGGTGRCGHAAAVSKCLQGAAVALRRAQGGGGTPVGREDGSSYMDAG